jgi:hypothetical protein
MGGVEHTEDFCKDCSPPSGFEGMSIEEIMALSVVGKKCEFCERDAVSGVRESTHATYWCLDCGREYSRLLSQILAERPDLMATLSTAVPSLFTSMDSEMIAWSNAASDRAIQMMKDRGKHDKGELGSGRP